MLKQATKNKLIKNWGEQADAMNCFTEVKFIDPLSNWACYIYALNPDNQDDIACLIHTDEVDICDWSLKELYSSYNSEGEHPEIDTEFRPVLTSYLFKKLSNE